MTGYLWDVEIYLYLTESSPADESKGYVPSYTFQICLCHSGTPVGEVNLRIGSNENTYYGGNIGYEVYPPHRGHHYALKACRLLLSLAAKHGMKSLLITCNPDNLPSRRTCELLGARLVQTLDLPPHNDMYQDGERQKCQYEFAL